MSIFSFFNHTMDVVFNLEDENISIPDDKWHKIKPSHHIMGGGQKQLESIVCMYYYTNNKIHCVYWPCVKILTLKVIVWVRYDINH